MDAMGREPCQHDLTFPIFAAEIHSDVFVRSDTPKIYHRTLKIEDF